MNIKLSELIKDNKVYFNSYRQGFFYYNIPHYINTDDQYLAEGVLYQFPIPQDDIGNATLLNEDKAIYFLRWIRKAQEEGTLTKGYEIKLEN